MTRSVAAALATLILVVACRARAEDCISKHAKKSFAQCPRGVRRTKVTSLRPITFWTKPREVESTLDPVPEFAWYGDQRAGAIRWKPRRLLAVEMANLERIYRTMLERDKDRPRLMRRLAEGYVELESSAFRDKIEHETKALESRKAELVIKHDREAQKAAAVMNAARGAAIKYYNALRRQYPTWCQYPKNPSGERSCTDEVLYYLAYEYEGTKNVAMADKIYRELVDKWPRSKFVPHAYLARAERAFDEARSDPSKWPVAARLYQEVLEHRPPDNKVWGYAASKLAYVHFHQRAHEKAIHQFRSVVELAQQHPALPNVTSLAKSAWRNLLTLYALAGDPARAYHFFRPLADPAAPNAMVEKLGQKLLAAGRHREAVVLYRQLLTRNPSSCLYQACVTEAVMGHTRNKKTIVAELRRLLDLHEASGQCANDTAALMAENALRWHVEAVGQFGQRGTGDPQTTDYALELYQVLVERFTEKQFRGFKFPRIEKRNLPDILYAKALLHHHRKDWDKCAATFDMLAADPRGPYAAEAAYGAVLCSHEPDLERANRYLCSVAPDRSDPQAFERHCEVRYARARAYAEAQRWDEAALGFRDVAMTCQHTDVAARAVQPYLDALNTLGSGEPARLGCFEKIEKDVATFLVDLCYGNPNREPCALLFGIQRDVVRLKSYFERDDAKVYLDGWNTYGQHACSAENPACQGWGEMLYNAARALHASGQRTRAIGVRRRLARHTILRKTWLGQLAAYELAGDYEALALYDFAAERYEAFARDYPSHDQAGVALSRAVLLRLGLGESAQAIDDAAHFDRTYSTRDGARAAEVSFAMARHYADREDWRNAERSLAGSAMRAIDEHAEPVLRLRAHSLLGSIYTKLDRHAQADGEYRQVLRAWKGRARRATQAPALDAVGQAMFHFAEKKRRAAEAMRYALPQAIFACFEPQDCAYAKEQALLDAEKGYLELIDLQPMLPKWRIKAHAAAGHLWEAVVDEWRHQPRLPGLRSDAEERARHFLMRCLEDSVSSRYFDEDSRSCERSLSRFYPAEFHVFDEPLFPAPLSPLLFARAPALELDDAL